MILNSPAFFRCPILMGNKGALNVRGEFFPLSKRWVSNSECFNVSSFHHVRLLNLLVGPFIHSEFS